MIGELAGLVITWPAVVLAEPLLDLALPQPALRGAQLLRRGHTLPIEPDLLLQVPADLVLLGEAEVQLRRAHEHRVLLQHREAARGRELGEADTRAK